MYTTVYVQTSTYGLSNGPNAFESMRQMQYMQNQQEMMMRMEQERKRSEEGIITQLQSEIQNSKAETER